MPILHDVEHAEWVRKIASDPQLTREDLSSMLLHPLVDVREIASQRLAEGLYASVEVLPTTAPDMSLSLWDDDLS